MADIFNATDPFQTGLDNAAKRNLTQAQGDLTAVNAADAERKAQQDINLDTASRSALQNVYGTPGPTPGPVALPTTPGVDPTVTPTPPPPSAPATPLPAAPQGADQSSSATPAPAVGPNAAPVGMTPTTQAVAPQAAPVATAPAPNAAPYGPARGTALTGALSQAYANTPGGGQAAVKLNYADVAAQTEVMHRAFEMAATDPVMAQQFAQNAGMPIPPQMQAVMQNAGARQQVLGIFDDASKLYPNERDAVQKWQYVQGRMQSLREQANNPNAAAPPMQPGAAPVQPREPKPDFEPQAITTFGQDAQGHTQPYVGVFDPNAQTVTPTDVQGVARGSGSIGRSFMSGGANSVYADKQQAWLAVHPGDAAGALEYASGHKQMNQADLYKSAHTMAYQEVTNDPSIKPAAKAVELQKRQNAYFQTLQSLNGMPAAAPAGGGAPSQAQPLPQDRSQLQPGTVYQTNKGPGRYIGNGQFQTIQ